MNEEEESDQLLIPLKLKTEYLQSFEKSYFFKPRVYTHSIAHTETAKAETYSDYLQATQIVAWCGNRTRDTQRSSRTLNLMIETPENRLYNILLYPLIYKIHITLYTGLIQPSFVSLSTQTTPHVHGNSLTLTTLLFRRQ